jgi:hypothetical protein
MLDPALSDALHYPLLALAILANLISALLIASTWQSLPSTIPAHFGLSGEPDRWGGRWHLFLLLAVQSGTNVAFLISGTTGLILNWLQAITSILFAFVVWSTIRVALGEARRLHPAILYGLMALMIVPAIAQSFK